MLVCPLCRLTLADNETTCPRDGHEGVEARAAEVPPAVRARFSVVEPYAQGASGDLYIADDRQTSRRGVLKILHLPDRVTPAERARLKRELVKQATLSSAVLSVPLATGDADGQPWVFREWHEGVSLKVKLTRGGALAAQEAFAIAAQIASALDELHRSGLLHRDLKPGHVIVEPQPSGLPRVTLIDAGITARIDTSSVFDVTGTAEYVAPEQADGKLVSFRSDLYALGCVLFEMITGAPPFSGTPEDLLKAHLDEPTPTPQVSLPTGVSSLLSQLLAKEPRERPFSAQQVRRALEPFLPQDSSARREATQTFERLTDRRRVPSVGSGTLPPPDTKQASIRKTSVPPPPPPAAFKPSGLPLPPPASPEWTMELSSLDLEEADVALEQNSDDSDPDAQPAQPVPKPPAPKQTLLGMPPAAVPGTFATKSSDRAAEPKPATLGALTGNTPLASEAPTPVGTTTPGDPVPGASVPPWQSHELRPTEPPPFGGNQDEDEGLDYDDLAETVAFDRNGHPSADALVQASVQASDAPASHAPVEVRTHEPTAAPVSSSRRALPLLLLFGAVGVCLVSSLALGVGFWWTAQRAFDPMASSQTAPVGAPTPTLPTPAPAPAVGMDAPAPERSPVAGATGVLGPEASDEAPVEEPAAPETEEVPGEEPASSDESMEPADTAAEATDRSDERDSSEEAHASARAAVRPEERAARAAAARERAERFEAVRRQALEHFRARRFPQAAQAYEQATQLNPRHAGSFAGLGAARLALGQHQRAVRAYQRAVTLQPRHAGFHAALGRAYHLAGDHGRARQSYQRALALDSSNQAARQGLQSLGG